MAHGFSTADFRHGPIAVCRPDTPALLFAGSATPDEDTRALIAELTQRGAPLRTAGTDPAPVCTWPEL